MRFIVKYQSLQSYNTIFESAVRLNYNNMQVVYFF